MAFFVTLRNFSLSLTYTKEKSLVLMIHLGFIIVKVGKAAITTYRVYQSEVVETKWL